MKNNTKILTATGPSNWIRLNTQNHSGTFQVGLYCDVNGGSTLTYKVQHGFYAKDNDRIQTDNITRAATVATVVLPFPIAVQVGDSVVVYAAGAPLDGTYDVASVISTTSFTYTVANSGAVAASPGATILIIHVGDHPVLTGKTTSSDGNIAFPVSFVRANVTAFTSGSLAFTVVPGG